jgi:hypothetical protein
MELLDDEDLLLLSVMSTYRANLKRRMLDKILYDVDNKRHSLTITIISFIGLYINRYINRFLKLLWKFFLTSNRISKFVDLIT